MILNTPLLRPLFMAIARLPVIGPHAGHEVALLKSGAKKAGYLPPHEIARVQDEIDAGTLTRVDVVRAIPVRGHLFLRADTPPEHAQMTDIAACHRYLCSGREADEQLSATFQRVAAQTGLVTPSIVRGPEGLPLYERAVIEGLSRLPEPIQNFFGIQNKIDAHIQKRHIEQFLDGDRQALIIPSHDYAQQLPDTILRQRMDAQVQSGAVIHGQNEFTIDMTLHIVAQPGATQDIADLQRILTIDYLGGKSGLPPTREGQALGYSDADIHHWNSGRQDYGAVARFVLQHTNEMRRDLRVALMQDAGPKWPRNP